MTRTWLAALIVALITAIVFFQSRGHQQSQQSLPIALDEPTEQRDKEPLEAIFADDPEVATNDINAALKIKNIPVAKIRKHGRQVIPILAKIYSDSDDDMEKARVAWVFWKLGWQSELVEQTLLPDLDTQNTNLKVWVQWGIAKSTQSTTVIEKLLYNLANDSSPFVRDKAACALASDFTHISPRQRIIILRGLIEGLDSETLQIRKSSITALKVQTGQTKGFSAKAEKPIREERISAWNDWLDEYELNI